MKIFDKAQWHIDAGEEKREVVDKFKAIFKFLNDNEMLSLDGKEIYDLGIDASISLNERMLNEKGNTFLCENYDKIINYTSTDIVSYLMKLNI